MAVLPDPSARARQSLLDVIPFLTDVPFRRHVTIFVEFHNLPGADYETILAELPKYGVNLGLAMQSLARLDALHRLSGRSLKADVFANLSGLFAFNVSSKDAEDLVPELGNQVSTDDLLALRPHRCYVKLAPTADLDVDPHPAFLAKLDPPPAPNEHLAESLVRRSAALYGRETAQVEGSLRSSMARVEQARNRWYQEVSGGNTGVPRDLPDDAKNGENNRSEHRRRKRKKPEPHRGRLSGFFLEYDRGTMSRVAYIHKLETYYRYRDSFKFTADFVTFPWLLFVTTSDKAEKRLAGAALSVGLGRVPLQLLLTAAWRLKDKRNASGILGKVWRPAEAPFSYRRDGRIHDTRPSKERPSGDR